jgi:hypothetical protein
MTSTLDPKQRNSNFLTFPKKRNLFWFAVISDPPLLNGKQCHNNSTNNDKYRRSWLCPQWISSTRKKQSYHRDAVLILFILIVVYSNLGFVLIQHSLSNDAINSSSSSSSIPTAGSSLTSLFDFGNIHKTEQQLVRLLNNNSLLDRMMVTMEQKSGVESLSSSFTTFTRNGITKHIQIISDFERHEIKQKFITSTNYTTPYGDPQEYEASLATRYIRNTVASLLQLQLLGNPEERRSGLWKYQWFLVKGQAMFVRQDCSDDEHVFYSTNYAILLPSSSCHHGATEITQWRRMRRFVDILGTHQQMYSLGITSLTFYANHNDIHFYAVKTQRTTLEMVPFKLRRLLVAALYLNSNVWTSDFIERIVKDPPWTLVTISNGRDKDLTSHRQFMATTHTSVSSLCQNIPLIHPCPNPEMITIGQNYSLQCVSLQYNKNHKIKDHVEGDVTLKIYGQWIIPTFQTVIVRVDWMWALAVAILLLLSKGMGIGAKKDILQARLTLLIYFLAVIWYKYQQPYNAGLVSSSSSETIYTSILDSIHVFRTVHPISSRLLAWSHILTYWFEVAAWRSQSMQGVLFWFLCYEFAASYINEYTHGLEDDNAIRCTRVTFIASMKQFAIHDFIRAYLLPPFLVYCYLLPNLIWDYIVTFVF